MIDLDFETYSELDVRNVGSHVYARHPSTEILMMAYSIDGGSISLWVPDGKWDYDSIPAEVLEQFNSDEEVWAHNIEFEENCLRHCLGITIPFDRCRDTAILSLTKGFPMSLDGAAKAVGIDAQKDSRGKALIRKFCAPRKPTKHNKSTRWDPSDAPEDWADFCDYCITDVKVEMELKNRLCG